MGDERAANGAEKLAHDPGHGVAYDPSVYDQRPYQPHVQGQVRSTKDLSTNHYSSLICIIGPVFLC